MNELVLTKEHWESEVTNSDVPVLVDFWAVWCGPGRMIAPVLDEIEKEMPDVKFCKINVDEEPELTRLFKVQSIPTVALVKDNTLVDISVGLVPKDKLVKLINDNK